MIIQPAAALPCAMLLAAIIGAHWLGNKKILLLDFFVALVVLILLIAIGIQVYQVLR